MALWDCGDLASLLHDVGLVLAGVTGCRSHWSNAATLANVCKPDEPLPLSTEHYAHVQYREPPSHAWERDGVPGERHMP
jgi:hypothetical protein